MKIPKDLQSLQAELRMSSALRNVKDSRYADMDKKIATGLEDVPVRKMYEQAQHIEQVLLPKIEQARGADHPDYIFFRSVFLSLLWAIAVLDRNEFMTRKNIELRMLGEFYRDQCTTMERELSKYQTLEELCLSDALSTYAETVARRAAELLKNNPSR